jgi:glutamine amidotransferase
MMNIIIDYGVGNIGSVTQGLIRAGIEVTVSSDLDEIEQADVLFLPGVGAFNDAMSALKNTGLIPTIKNHVKSGKLLVGICLGMQLLFEESSEYGYTKGLGFLKGRVDYLDVPYKVPHMGWNALNIKKEDTLFKIIQAGDYVYFVHSYGAICDSKYILASVDYGQDIPAIVRHDNVIGYQFHPEKSGQVGLQLLKNIKELSR